jgi:hypothetical protein
MRKRHGPAVHVAVRFEDVKDAKQVACVRHAQSGKSSGNHPAFVTRGICPNFWATALPILDFRTQQEQYKLRVGPSIGRPENGRVTWNCDDDHVLYAIPDAREQDSSHWNASTSNRPENDCT